MMTDDLPRRAGARTPKDTTGRADAEFDALFLAHYDSVFRQAYRVTASAQEAEDLAQETFIRLYSQRPGPGRDHNMRAWLLKVVTNLAYNAVRGEGRRSRREEAVYGERIAASDPASDALRSVEQETVRRVLHSLPERQSRLLFLRHAGLSYREPASALEIAPGSVGTLLARAHAAFAVAYQQAAGKEAGGDENDT